MISKTTWLHITDYMELALWITLVIADYITKTGLAWTIASHFIDIIATLVLFLFTQMSGL